MAEDGQLPLYLPPVTVQTLRAVPMFPLVVVVVVVVVVTLVTTRAPPPPPLGYSFTPMLILFSVTDSGLI